MQCPKCGNQLAADAKFCEKCGTKIESVASYSFDSKVKCPRCGTAVNSGARFCEACGCDLTAPEPRISRSTAKKEKKKDTALIILIVTLAAVILVCAVAIIFIFSGNSSDEDSSISKKHSEEYEEDADEEALKPKKAKKDKEETSKTQKEEAEEYYGAPKFDFVKASSTLPSQGSNDYYASKAADDNAATAWTEGAEGSGEGETLTFYSNSKQKVSKIKILNGYCKNEELYFKNNRIQHIRISFSDGSSITKKLDDNFFQYNIIELDEPVICTTVTFSIIDVYRGTTYDDTCISEVEFY